ncbi:MAG TPA: hydantoinase B/oxoprolinase family protein [Anaerolineae bacterium]|nr:hydantoinase B/oxoprolinase family protein [Anaerolineae bacterium]
MQSRKQVDPIKFEVIRSALGEATEEMAAALRHSAYSTNIKTRADFSCALFDRHLQTWPRPSLSQSTWDLCRIFDRYHLDAGCTIVGPAVVEEIDSTTVIHPGYRAEVDRLANLLLTKSSPGST